MTQAGDREERREDASLLEAGARELARAHAAAAASRSSAEIRALVRRLDERLEAVDRRLRAGEGPGAGSPGAEWLLDNRHLTVESIHQITEDLPRRFLRELPVVEVRPGDRRAGDEGSGDRRPREGRPDERRSDDPRPGEGRRFSPRVHEITGFLVREGRAYADLDRAVRFLAAYQEVLPLSMGEIWAFPALLRVSVLEHLAEQGEAVAGLAPPRGEESGDWIPGLIRTLRSSARTDWAAFFEESSRVERVLREGDPSGHYAAMDFATRDRYRKAVEELARGSGLDEEAVARQAVEAAPVHVGEVLTGPQRRTLERRIGFRPGFALRASRWMEARALPLHVGGILLLAVPLLGLLLLPLRSGSPIVAAVTALLAALPAISVASAIMNAWVTSTLPPRVLPKLELEEGIPPEARTTLVVPCLLTDPEEIDGLVRQLELNVQGNQEAELRYVLLSDHVDANAREMPGDEKLLEAARQGIRKLNERYGDDGRRPFLLLHRERRWNPAQERWMGWERKRGKLDELNRAILSGDFSTFPHQEGDPAELRGTRFILTLDADTFVPQGVARRLAGTALHPLNRPRFDAAGRLVRGYSVLQPRVETLPADPPQTLFARIFGTDRGLDLYSQAVSDVYHDRFGTGIFAGKGLYDLEAFHRSLEGRVPENALLSHDLFEGAHGRVGLVSDVTVFEDFPDRLETYLRRLHRWVRGDWQIAPWIFPRVPMADGGRGKSGIGLLGRWQILDNLRRSLHAPSLLGFLLAGWLLLPGPSLYWTLAVLAVVAIPVVFGSGAIFRARVVISRRWAPIRDRLRLRAAGTLRWLLSVVFLPHQAWVETDAIARTLYRLFVSRRNLLEWTSAAQAARAARSGGGYLRQVRLMVGAPILALVVGGLLALRPGPFPLHTLPLLLAWFLSPALAHWTARTWSEGELPLSPEDRRVLRGVARRTWAWFEEFMGPEDHWLPPDHFQEWPRSSAAHRTSPTNIGLALTSTLAAYDLGYLTLPRLAATLSSTLDGMDRLERHRGHLLNWHNTRDLNPLEPRYVSTVDSGNLAGCLIMVAHGCREVAGGPVLRKEEVEGMADTVRQLREVLDEVPTERIAADVPLLERIDELEGALERSSAALEEAPWTLHLLRVEVLGTLLPELEGAVGEIVGDPASAIDPAVLRRIRGWIVRVRNEAESAVEELETLVPWLPVLYETPPELRPEAIDDEVGALLERLRRTLAGSLSLRTLPRGVRNATRRLKELRAATAARGEAPEEWLERLESELALSALRADALLGDLGQIERRCLRWVEEMDFSFLYDRRKQIFHIGYDAGSGELDGSYYDLLASEARIASYIAIAKGDVPARHWVHLGRPFGKAGGSAILLSWSGTLFEYLMPSLYLRSPDRSLLAFGCRAAIARQMEHARQRDVPWGVSESAYHELDARSGYRYRAFGVPDLALRREVDERVVIAPYASVLALPFQPRKAFENLERLRKLGMFGAYGFYDSLDLGENGSRDSARIVRSFMAHHQGMILTALVNQLLSDRMVERFHRDPRIEAASYLLYENGPDHVRLERRVPVLPAPVVRKEVHRAVEPWPVEPEAGHPAVHVLSNGTASVTVTGRGGGGITLRDRAVTRWRTDPDPDAFGSWIYLADLDDGRLWGATAEPVPGEADEEGATFAPHEVEYRRSVAGVRTRLTVTLPPEGAVELRTLTVTNRSERHRRLRVASFGEVSLAPPGEDRRHPAFQKLFVESEYAAARRALLFRRRRSSPEEPRVHVAHGVGATTGAVRLVGWETDRGAFFGRGGSPAAPRALRSAAVPAGRAGATLDPIFSLQLDVDLPPGGEAEIGFATAVGASRGEVLDAIDAFRSRESVRWGAERARMRWEAVLRRLGMPPSEVRPVQALLAAALVPRRALRVEEGPAAESSAGAEADAGHPLPFRRDALWGLGISGDHPIVLMAVADAAHDERVTQLLRGHAYWRALGVKVDVVLLDETMEGYLHPVRDRVQAALARLGTTDAQGRPGGIHHVPAGRLGPAHRSALEAAAQVRLASGRELREQLEEGEREEVRLPTFVPVPGPAAEPAAAPPLEPPADLLFWNGLGGFTEGGGEYLIHLEEGAQTPAPWVNVIATPEMGFIISERGSACTWAGNSAEHRLTPWANDPVLDRPGEALYLRDEETAEVWSPTPGPAPAPGAHQIRHAAGSTRFLHRSHGLEQEVEHFAALDPAAKVVELTLRNLSGRRRRVTATYFAEWVLGRTPGDEASHVVTRFDGGAQCLLAENRLTAGEGPRVGFLAADRPLHDWTADRSEFLGRGGVARPAGLGRIGLAKTAGAGLEPCGALQVHLDLEPAAHVTARFFLGAAPGAGEATARVAALRRPDAVARARGEVRDFWDGLLSRTVVATPDPALDLFLNRWGRYQALSCRLWGRSALYQSAGAYGFRDQLQDVIALIPDASGIAREHLLQAAQHQFEEGDVLHWWHPPGLRGVRTRCSDDLLWLPWAVAAYVKATGDEAVLRERVPFLSAPPLEPGEGERYATFVHGEGGGSLHEHCLRALRAGLTGGPHGLPLMGAHDWNDGMNRVGIQGRGESVWLGWFAGATAAAYAELCERRGEGENAIWLRGEEERLREAVERAGWDGAWYLRAIHDDGSPMGHDGDPEGKIDAIAQSWAVLSGLGRRDRSEKAMASFRQFLVDRTHGLALLLSPPFDRDPRWPGYIRAYPPGIRENGGQYSHAAAWSAWALARLGLPEEALEIFHFIVPIERTSTPDGAARYRTEPYAVAGDIGGPPHHPGRGGWSWFTGSAAWTHRLGLEAILGFVPEGGGVRIDPRVPASWSSFRVTMRRGEAEYRFLVELTREGARNEIRVELDGEPLPDNLVPLEDDGRVHEVLVRVGALPLVPGS